MTLIEKLQPLMDEYTLIKLKIEQLRNKQPIPLNAIRELQKESIGVCYDIMDVIYRENKLIIEEKLKQLTA